MGSTVVSIIGFHPIDLGSNPSPRIFQMKKDISKTGAKEKIENFFEDIKNKSPKEIKKIKRVAMKFKIPLKEKKKLFCGNCLNPYSGNEKVRLRNETKSVTCKNCGKISRWKISK